MPNDDSFNPVPEQKVKRSGAFTNDRTLSRTCHLSLIPSLIAAWILSPPADIKGVFFHVIILTALPFSLWKFNREKSPLIDSEGKQAINFQLSFFLYTVGLVWTLWFLTQYSQLIRDLLTIGVFFAIYGIPFILFGYLLSVILKTARLRNGFYPLAIPFLREEEILPAGTRHDQKIFSYPLLHFINEFFCVLITSASIAMLLFNPSLLRGHPMPHAQLLRDPFTWILFLGFIVSWIWLLTDLSFEVEVSQDGISVYKLWKQAKFLWEEITALEMSQEMTTRTSSSSHDFYKSYHIHVKGAPDRAFFIFDSRLKGAETLLHIVKEKTANAEFIDPSTRYQRTLKKMGTTAEDIQKKPFWQLPQKIILPIFIGIILLFLFYGWLIRLIFE